MHILCDKQALIDAVGNVQRGVSGKSTLPALEGILLRASGSSLFLAGYDLEMGITTTIEAPGQRARGDRPDRPAVRGYRPPPSRRGCHPLQ